MRISAQPFILVITRMFHQPSAGLDEARGMFCAATRGWRGGRGGWGGPRAARTRGCGEEASPWVRRGGLRASAAEKDKSIETN